MEISGYKILETIGEGGMATVYRAMQLSLNRVVALKVLSQDLISNEDFCEQFLAEGKLIARLSHSSIVTIYDIGKENDHYYMSMEYFDGDNLRNRIDQGLQPSEIILITRQIARALGYAHDQGILHRDVKPHNVMFRSNGMAVLSDFGIARNLSDESDFTRDGKLIGSPLYISPEQIRNEKLDIRSDLYSLGIMMYQMLTKYVPYLATTADSTTRMHLSCPLPKMPPELGDFQPIITRLLAKSKEDRFSNAWELIDALDAISGHSIDRNITMEAQSVSFPDSTPEVTPDSTQEMEETEQVVALQYSELESSFDTNSDHTGLDVDPASYQNDDSLENTVHLNSQKRSRKISLALASTLVLGLMGILGYPYLVGKSGMQKTVVAESPTFNAETKPVEAAMASAGKEEAPKALDAEAKDIQLAENKEESDDVNVAKEDAQKAEIVAHKAKDDLPAAIPEADKPETQLAIKQDREKDIENQKAEKTSATASLAELNEEEAIAEDEPKAERTLVVKSATEVNNANTEDLSLADIPLVNAAKIRPLKETEYIVPENQEVILSDAPLTGSIHDMNVVAEHESFDQVAMLDSDDNGQIEEGGAIKTLSDSGVMVVNGENWISHELENKLRLYGQQITRLDDGSLSLLLEQGTLFEPGADQLIPSALRELDQLAYTLRNHSGFSITIYTEKQNLDGGQVFDLGLLRAERIQEYLIEQLVDPGHILISAVDETVFSQVNVESLELRLSPYI